MAQGIQKWHTLIGTSPKNTKIQKTLKFRSKIALFCKKTCSVSPSFCLLRLLVRNWLEIFNISFSTLDNWIFCCPVCMPFWAWRTLSTTNSRAREFVFVRKLWGAKKVTNHGARNTQMTCSCPYISLDYSNPKQFSKKYSILCENGTFMQKTWSVSPLFCLLWSLVRNWLDIFNIFFSTLNNGIFNCPMKLSLEHKFA